MPDPSFLTSIIRDTGPFSAEYVPLPVEEKPVTGCDIPGPVQSLLNLPTLPTLTNELDCNLNFVPIPIVPVPFVPPFEGPCPSGFHFEAQFIPAIGQCFTQQAASGGRRALTLQNFTAEDAGITADTEHVLPDIRLTLPVTNTGTEPSGAYKYAIEAGKLYHVSLDSYNPSTDANNGLIYNAVLYKHGTSFRGVAGQGWAAVSHTSLNARMLLELIQHQRILDYDRSSGGNTVYVAAEGFTLPSSSAVCGFSFNRLVIGADQQKETGGTINFIQEPCGGKLIGEININFDDLNIPCADGFQFDAGYSPKISETVVVTDGSKVSSSTVDLLSLVPTGVSPQTGLTYPLPKIRINTTGSTWVTAQVTGINNDINGVWLTTTGGFPNGTYANWYIQRINVETGSPTGGQFEFIKQGDCGGKLVGLIQIDVPSLTTPCATALQDNTLITPSTNFGVGDDLLQASDWRALKSVDRLRSRAEPNSTGWTVDPPTTRTVTLASHGDACNYKLGFNGGAQINLPNIQIQLRIGDTGQWQRFKRTYTDGVTDTITFEGTIDRGQLGGGTGEESASCLSCCRWS